MSSKGTLLLAGVGLLFSAGGLSAQRAPSDGMWFGAAIGGSSARLSCQVCAGERETAVSGFVQIGGTFNPQFRYALEGGGWRKDGPTLNQWIGSLGLVGYFSPRSDGGLYFKGGPSALYYSATDEDDDEVTSRSYGVVVGMGYALSNAGSLVFRPAITVHASSFGRLSSRDETVASDVNLSLIQLSIGISTR